MLVGGLFADGHVASEVRTAPVVPLAAVDERGLRPFVMRIKNGKVEKTEVELGHSRRSDGDGRDHAAASRRATRFSSARRAASREKTPVKVSRADTTSKQ